MMIFWTGRGWYVTWLTLAGMVLPMLLLRQIDGPEVDRGVALAMGLAALATLGLGLRWNRGARSGAAAHAFMGIPMHYWAVPMLGFALLLGTGTITTAEESRPPRAAPATNLK